ncbi:MAG: hypothetical protein J2P15_24620 [Micromonosporaceae bacterium]|nr:hypothetical protein [Micromonosporaceae bacterium]
MSGWSQRMLAAAIRLLPVRRRELGQALLAEAAVVPPGWRRTRWVASGLWFVAREGAMRMVGYAVGLLAAAATLVVIDRIGSSDDSGQVSMLVLLLGAAALGFASPRWAWLAALVVGSAIAVSGLATAALDPASPRLAHIGGVGGAAGLFVLVVPALAGAYAGAGLRWLIRRSR